MLDLRLPRLSATSGSGDDSVGGGEYYSPGDACSAGDTGGAGVNDLTFRSNVKSYYCEL